MLKWKHYLKRSKCNLTEFYQISFILDFTDLYSRKCSVSFAVIFQGKEGFDFCCSPQLKWQFESDGAAAYVYALPVFVLDSNVGSVHLGGSYLFSARENGGNGDRQAFQMATDNFLFLLGSLHFSVSLPSLLLTLSVVFSLSSSLHVSAHKDKTHTHTHTLRNTCLWCNENIFPQESMSQWPQPSVCGLMR